MTSNKIQYNPATSPFVLIADLNFKNSHTHNMLLLIELTGKYTYHKQVKVVYNYIDIEKLKA
jgi:hypothetical protein